MFGKRTLAFKLEQMQQFAELGVIRRGADGLGKSRRSKTAAGALGHAKGSGKARGFRRKEVTATGTEIFRLRMAGRIEPAQAGMTDSHGSEIRKRSAAKAAIRRKENRDKVRSCPTGNPQPRLRTSENARHRTPSGRACVLARWALSAELDIPHACDAEDGPHSRHREKKHQQCRWLQFTSTAFFRQLWVNPGWCPFALRRLRGGAIQERILPSVRS